MCAPPSLLGLLCHADFSCSSWASQLPRGVGGFPPLEVCMVSFATMKARLRKGIFRSARAQGGLWALCLKGMASSALGTYLLGGFLFLTLSLENAA